MGLGFHIGQNGIDDLGEYIDQLEMDEHFWLKKNGFLVEGKTGHLPDDPEESLPYFDDVILTHEQVLSIKKVFDSRKIEVFKTPGLKSIAVEKMDRILTRVIAEREGLSTCAD